MIGLWDEFVVGRGEGLVGVIDMIVGDGWGDVEFGGRGGLRRLKRVVWLGGLGKEESVVGGLGGGGLLFEGEGIVWVGVIVFGGDGGEFVLLFVLDELKCLMFIWEEGWDR